MKILSLELTDFGPHAHRLDKINSSVVGLIGPNGAGKTNMLRGLKFAFTGELDDPQDTYIRGRGIMPEGTKEFPGAAKSAEVKLHFAHHGQEGAITRRITPTSSTRRLVWDGEEMTRANDVDAALNDILGADKKALAEIVFPMQGELHKMLFGKQAEREETFIKLLLLAHFAKVSDLAENKARLLRYEVEDLTAQKEQLHQLLEQQTSLMAEAEADFGRCSSWAAEIELRAKAQAARQQVATLQTQLEHVSLRLVPLKQQRETSAAELQVRHDGASLNAADSNALHVAITDVESLVVDITTRRDAQLKAYRDSQTRRSLEAELVPANAAAAELNDEVATLTQLEKQAAEAGLDAAAVAQGMTTLRQATDLTERVGAIQQQAAAQWDVWKAAETQLLACNAVPDKSHDLEALQKVWDKLNLQVELSGKCVGADMTECPVCQSKLTHAIDATKLEELRAELTRGGDRVRELRTYEHERLDNIRKAETDESVAKQHLNRLAGELERAKAALAALVLPSLPLEQLEHYQREATGRTERLRQIQVGRLVEQAGRKVFDLTQAIAALPPSGTYNEAELEACNAALPSLQDYLSRASALRNTLNTIDGQLRTIENQTADIQTQGAKAEATLTEVLAQYPSRLKELEQLYPPDQVDRTMREWEDHYRSAQGALEQARKHMQLTSARLQELVAREDADRLRKQLADELSQVKEAFHRRGLPMVYVQYRYHQLVELANRNLNVLDATFAVETDPTQLVSLNFRRTDDDSDALFSMSKLSGGQRVRLSIAFLLAVQQLIIPELGLLVLDEPTTHLNSEGVESLADLLQNLGTQLASADAQIIVCDHNHLLERAFQTTIRLG